MIAFGGRRGPHRSGSRCRGRPIERREAGREGCLWPNAASQGRPPDGSGGESERSTQNGRAKTLCGGGGAHTNSELPQAGFPESGEVYFRSDPLWLELRRLPPIMGFAYKYSLLRKNHSTLQRGMLHTAADVLHANQAPAPL